MTRNAILFRSGDNPFTHPSRPSGFSSNEARSAECKSILYNLGAHSYLSCGTCDE